MWAQVEPKLHNVNFDFIQVNRKCLQKQIIALIQASHKTHLSTQSVVSTAAYTGSELLIMHCFEADSWLISDILGFG